MRAYLKKKMEKEEIIIIQTFLGEEYDSWDSRMNILIFHIFIYKMHSCFTDSLQLLWISCPQVSLNCVPEVDKVISLLS